MPRRASSQRWIARGPALLGAVVLALLCTPGMGYSLFVRENAWAPNGPVTAIATSNNTLYIGGSFSRVGPVSGPAVAVDFASGLLTSDPAHALKPFPRVTGKVRAVEPDGNGGWYIGGAFAAVQGQPRNNLAQIDSSGNLTSWNPDVNGEVDDIALGSGVVYVGGSFTAVGATSRTYAAAIDVASGMATSWACLLDGPVTEVELGGNAVYLGGTFTTANGQPYVRLAALQVTTGTPTGLFLGLNPDLIGIDALEFSAGRLFVSFHYTYGYYLKVLVESPLNWLPYNLSSDGPIYDITTHPFVDLAYIGGSFSTVAGQPRSNLAAIEIQTGALWAAWDIATDGPVRTLASFYFDWGNGSSSSGVMVGGSFGSVGGLARRNVASVSLSTSYVYPWTFFCEGAVYALEPGDAKIYLGGDFSIVNGVPRSNLAALDATAGALLDWNPTTNAAVDALMVSGNTLYVGGQFSTVNGVGRNRAAAVDLFMGALTAFNPNVEVTFPTTVYAFAMGDGLLYMGGAFGRVGGIVRNGIAAVDPTTGGLSSWNPNVGGAVYAVSFVPGGIFGGAVVIIGGQFTLVGGQVRYNLANLNAATGASSALHNPNGSVRSLLVEPLPPGYGGFNDIYIGGAFTSVGGQPRNGIAQLTNLSVLAWDPNANGVVEAITKAGNTVYVGGSFTSVGGQARNHIAAIDANNAAATTWDPNATGPELGAGYFVYDLLKQAGTVYAGGSFTTIAGTPQNYFAGISDGTVTAVESEPAREIAPAVRAAPNPFDRATDIQFSLASDGETRVTIFDVTGRRVRQIHQGWLRSGRHTLPWDGRDESGRPVAGGIYLVGVDSRSGHWGAKIYRLK